VIPKAAWAGTTEGAGVIGPEHVYYRAEDGAVDFGEVLRRAMVDRDRTRVASPIYASWNQLDGWLRAVDGLRRAA
jgi:hypothetical protein